MSRFLQIILVIAILVSVYAYLTNKSIVPSLDTKEKTNTAASIKGAVFNLEIADDDPERIQGLSGRKSLASNRALLFVFDNSSYHGIWMKDMKFPIDIFWLDDNLRVVSIKRDADPSSYPEVLTPSRPARYVLETRAGIADLHSIRQGDQLSIPNSDLIFDAK